MGELEKFEQAMNSALADLYNNYFEECVTEFFEDAQLVLAGFDSQGRPEFMVSSENNTLGGLSIRIGLSEIWGERFVGSSQHPQDIANELLWAKGYRDLAAQLLAAADEIEQKLTRR